MKEIFGFPEGRRFSERGGAGRKRALHHNRAVCVCAEKNKRWVPGKCWGELGKQASNAKPSFGSCHVSKRHGKQQQ
jgi:hypothetical protein